jgi:phage terminase large subunit-like protein
MTDCTDLTDDVGLGGAFCVWLSKEKRMWLNGRLLGATWDVDELLEKKTQIEGHDLLKFGYRVGDASAAGQSV